MFFKSSRKASKVEPLVLSTAPSAGIFAGTKIATRHRWARVEDLSVGDKVLTAENGEQVIADIEVATLSLASAKANAGQWPLLVPEGAIGNDHAMMVSPDTRLVIEDDAAGVLFGEACVTVRAENLIGYRGIARARVKGELTHVTIRFEGAETLVVEGGVFIDLPAPNGLLRFTPLNDRQSRLLTRNMGESDRKTRARPVAAGWI
ncbi:Hint domain-containing protein [Litoreibacter halocynthiae]|uniref:Hint domain-containing protein n=1 Tax=Litoreibacter halocynthiae TaxID=1242689 RepID=A0A4R7LLY0_9RHOB|nr:Hint domain-containing protein [Litoreibacter halocynthiae]TDT76983.1 Hint domain-containing protein [Litoreibacter halocynthiae]